MKTKHGFNLKIKKHLGQSRSILINIIIKSIVKSIVYKFIILILIPVSDLIQI